MLSKKYAVVDEKVCVACGVCVKECPIGAISVWKGCHAVVDKNVCIGCAKCAGNCPTGCIVTVSRGEA